jgi:putative Holliday junction resolvase
MTRILGLDPGTKRIGVAISDPTGVVAQSLNHVKRDQDENWVDEIENLVDEYQVREVVVGLPRNMNGSEGPAAADVRHMVQILQSRLKVPVEVWDERLTTVAAEKMFQETGVKQRQAKKHMDGVAAALILQGYLDYLAQRGGAKKG